MLIAEDLLLILLDDDEGSLSSTVHARTVLGGAMLVELALAGRVEVEERTRLWRTATVHLTHPRERAEDPLLTRAESTIAEKDRSAQDLVDRLGKGLVEQLGDRLVERGVLERKDTKVLGLFPRTRWPAASTEHEEQVRAELASALLRGATPQPRVAALIALLAAVGRAHKVVDLAGTPAKVVKARAAEIAQADWAAKAVRDALAAANAAVTAATLAATTAAAGGAVS